MPFPTSSPKSVAAQPPHHFQEGEELCGPPELSLCELCELDTFKSLSLDEFIAQLPDTIRKSNSKDENGHLSSSNVTFERGGDDDPISALYQRLDLNREDWERYALFEPSTKYTRNLVATDNETFTLILMCWNSGKESPIHNHPCDGCWMRVCEGSVQETRYVQEVSTDTLDCVSDNVFVGKRITSYILRLVHVCICANKQRITTADLCCPTHVSLHIMPFIRKSTSIHYGFYGPTQGGKSLKRE